jgi:hypothetical protein
MADDAIDPRLVEAGRVARAAAAGAGAGLPCGAAARSAASVWALLASAWPAARLQRMADGDARRGSFACGRCRARDARDPRPRGTNRAGRHAPLGARRGSR